MSLNGNQRLYSDLCRVTAAVTPVKVGSRLAAYDGERGLMWACCAPSLR
jgi:hypothetical protein